MEFTDFTEGDCACSEAVRLLDALVSVVGSFVDGFVGELLKESLFFFSQSDFFLVDFVSI